MDLILPANYRDNQHCGCLVASPPDSKSFHQMQLVYMILCPQLLCQSRTAVALEWKMDNFLAPIHHLDMCRRTLCCSETGRQWASRRVLNQHLVLMYAFLRIQSIGVQCMTIADWKGWHRWIQGWTQPSRNLHSYACFQHLESTFHGCDYQGAYHAKDTNDSHTQMHDEHTCSSQTRLE